MESRALNRPWHHPMLSCCAKHLKRVYTATISVGARVDAHCEGKQIAAMVPATIAIPQRVVSNLNHWGPQGLGPCAVACRPPGSVAHRAPHCVRAREVFRAARQHRMMAGSVQCPRFHRHRYSAGCTSLGAWVLADACTRTSSHEAHTLPDCWQRWL